MPNVCRALPPFGGLFFGSANTETRLVKEHF